MRYINYVVKKMKVVVFGFLLSLLSVATFAEGCDVAAGKKLFQVCHACHTLTQDVDPNLSGPSLKTLLGRTVGSLESFEYSPAMSEASFIWSAEKLRSFIKNPTEVVPWNGMPFRGIDSEEERKLIVCYIESATKK